MMVAVHDQLLAVSAVGAGQAARMDELQKRFIASILVVKVDLREFYAFLPF
jgi:hypothetical protein